MRRTSLVVAMLASLVLAGPVVHAAPGPLRVLVTNDDGIAAPGIDALVQALSATRT